MSARRPVRVAALALCACVLADPGFAQKAAMPAADARQKEVLRIAQEVRKQILSLPQYGVFDNLSFGIRQNTVILRGAASRPTLKSSAENVVKKIEGVESVENEIDVLPLSPNDDRIRAAVYVSIYGYGPLQRYTSNRGGGRTGLSVARAAGGITADPPMGFHAIHIIVKNGNVTLAGVVDNEGDLAIAEMRANSVNGVFSVQNELQVARKKK
ncbi:MAG TPA: BON domain-containing protein [Candidatus Acidoferrales bacterium]|nr:BON domain-containing protein [Candidatus Acidoferrales bacterium]